MKVLRLGCVLLAWLVWVPTGFADTVVPVQTTAPPAVTEPTSPPAVETAPAVTAVPPISDTSPVAPAPEYTRPTAGVAEPAVPPTALPAAISRVETGPPRYGVTLNPSVGRSIPPSMTSHNVWSAPASASSVGTVPQVSNQSSLAPPDVGSITAQTSPVSAQAPSQLTCRGTSHPDALPFLSSPYGGWMEVVSFFDHDSPDYTVDGKIVLANGITATAADGQESDLWPAYWAPSLRQYVNYDGHNGYDFSLSYQPVLAAGSGTVKFSGWNSSDPYAGYGQMVLIDHHNGYVTLYGHLSKLNVVQGQKVSAGEEIGISGTTGHSSGPHLHFSVFHDCNPTDPYGWTGSGEDPLHGYDGQQSSYLWLPGRDPLMVNPPRNWPTFPLGLRLPALAAASFSSTSRRSALPPVDRLLLLSLPESRSIGTSTPAVALARTEASITQEAEGIAPQLDELKAQGLVQKYAVIPAAAAVWVRGAATSGQLLNLPGVASLAGVQMRDLSAAQEELSHSVLTQIAHQQAPTLWPIGFRSALHAWRPLVTVVNNHALVAGMALPGERVALSLLRHGQIVGVAETRSDSDSGGFVAMLHDTAGNPVQTGPGDTVVVRSGGKIATLPVVGFDLQARTSGVQGATSARESIPLAYTYVGGSVTRSAVVSSGATGVFSKVASAHAGRSELKPGELVVATVADAAGNQEAASAFVPGAKFTLGSALVSGWTVGKQPRIVLIRNRHSLLSRRIHPAPDGTFELSLRLKGHVVPLKGGDLVRIGSIWHSRVIRIPQLKLRLRSGSSTVSIVAPKLQRVYMSIQRTSGSSVGRWINAGTSGTQDVSMTDAPATLGDEGTLRYDTSTGDEVFAHGQTRGMLVQVGTSSVSGTVHPGMVLSVRLLARDGIRLGGAVITTSATDGTFRVHMHDSSGRRVAIRPGTQIVLFDGTQETVTPVPALSIRRVGSIIVTSGRVTAGRTATWSIIDGQGLVTRRGLPPDRRGLFSDRYDLVGFSTGVSRVVVSTPAGDGITVQRTLSLVKPHKAVAATRAKQQTRSCSGVDPKHTQKSRLRQASCARTVGQ